jgi:hypothetical protein
MAQRRSAKQQIEAYPRIATHEMAWAKKKNTRGPLIPAAAERDRATESVLLELMPDARSILHSYFISR